MYVCVCVLLNRFTRVRLFVTLWTVACQAPLSMELSRQEYWSGLLCPPPGDHPNSEMEPRSPTLLVDSLPFEPPGKPKHFIPSIKSFLFKVSRVVSVLC